MTIFNVAYLRIDAHTLSHTHTYIHTYLFAHSLTHSLTQPETARAMDFYNDASLFQYVSVQSGPCVKALGAGTTHRPLAHTYA